MYPVAHVVVASGAAWTAERVVWRLFRKGGGEARGESDVNRPSLFDYRLVTLGALLPDIIDKPLAWWILDDGAYEHAFAHSLLFAAILTLPGLFFARRGDRRLLSVAFGDVMHLLCDPVMRTPQTLFWPLYGWGFDGTLGYAIHVTVDWRKEEAFFAAIAAVVLLRLWCRDRLEGLVLFGRL